jgi:Domain of unknown function (DUF6438)
MSLKNLNTVAVAICLMIAAPARGGQSPRCKDFATTPLTEDVVHGTVITLVHGRCWGPCPVYSIKIHGDGTVRFISPLPPPGIAIRESTNIGLEGVRALLKRFQRVNYTAFADSYSNPHRRGGFDGGGAVTTTSLSIGQCTKTVSDETGSAAPQTLRDLEAEIDRLAQTDKWLHRK